MIIGPGADNYEEMVDVDYLVFAGASWRFTEDKEWSPM
jgi:hypothetical protein